MSHGCSTHPNPPIKTVPFNPPFPIPVVQPRLPAPPSASAGRSCGTSLRPAPPDTFPEATAKTPGGTGGGGMFWGQHKTMENPWEKL